MMVGPIKQVKHYYMIMLLVAYKCTMYTVSRKKVPLIFFAVTFTNIDGFS